MSFGRHGCWIEQAVGFWQMRKSSGMLFYGAVKECRLLERNSRLLSSTMAWGKEEQLMPAWSFVIGKSHVVDMQSLVDVGVQPPTFHPSRYRTKALA